MRVLWQYTVPVKSVTYPKRLWRTTSLSVVRSESGLRIQGVFEGTSLTRLVPKVDFHRLFKPNFQRITRCTTRCSQHCKLYYTSSKKRWMKRSAVTVQRALYITPRLYRRQQVKSSAEIKAWIKDELKLVAKYLVELCICELCIWLEKLSGCKVT